MGGVLGGLAVIAGAFGAHGLQDMPSVDAKDLNTFEIAVRYHMYHALALVLLGVMLERRDRHRAGQIAGWLFLFGIAVFCGLLYAIALGGPGILGAIVPIGGLSFIAGWLALAAASAGTCK
jgi:uncharacterized membrane protein YgdD (TMEM256/DUF423 family)